MKNSIALKNELIFQYAAGTASLAKSLMASTYLFLNSKESNIYKNFENFCGNELANIPQVKPTKLKMEDCIDENLIQKNNFVDNNINPINQFIDSYTELNWKKIFKGFYEYNFKLTTNETAKLIKMDPGAKVPLHSHNGKEYILVLEGSFSDEYGEYKKGDLQINDFMIKHTPLACNKNGCICLSITEQELVFYGPFAPILNLITFIKTLFASNK